MNRIIARIYSTIFFEGPARGKTAAELGLALKTNGDEFCSRLAAMRRTSRLHAVVTHCIGIERWAQGRVRVALGEPFVDEEYDIYRPSLEVPWNDLIALFETTRRESIQLVQQCSGSALEKTVVHNNIGPLSVRGWFQYMQYHSRTHLGALSLLASQLPPSLYKLGEEEKLAS